ncbi:MAG: hypothetical protein ACHQVS_00055 [Candidatus Babeliales bacterium]
MISMQCASRIRFVLIGSIFLLPACYKRKSTQEACGPLEFFSAETSRDTLRSSLTPDAKANVSSSEKSKPLSRDKIRSQMHECQARLVDIPIPLQSTALERYFYAQDGYITLGYDVRGYVSDYTIFYEQGLERSGWRKTAALSAPFETLLIYDKPERFCVISLRHAESESVIPIRIMIYTGLKDAELS